MAARSPESTSTGYPVAARIDGRADARVAPLAIRPYDGPAPRAPKLPQATLCRAGPNAGDVMARSPAGRQPVQRETTGIDLRGLTGRIAAAGLILLLLIGGSFAGLFVAIEELRSADAQVTRSSADLRAANHVERLLIDMETGLRGFVITREERFLEPWDAGRQAFPGEVDALAQSADVLTQETRMRDVGAAGAAYIEEYGLPLIEAVRGGDPAASSVATTEAGKRRVDELRTLLTEFIDTERQTYIARQETAVDRAAAATNIATVAFGASVDPDRGLHGIPRPDHRLDR